MRLTFITSVLVSALSVLACETGKWSITVPDSITIGTPFTVKYCSPTYFKTSPAYISIVAAIQNTTITDSAVLLERSNNTYNSTDGFTEEVTFNTVYNYTEVYIGVLETYHGYGTPLLYEYFTTPNKISVNSAA